MAGKLIHNSKCTKGFPKPFHDQSTISDDSYANLCHHNTGKSYTLSNGKVVNNHWVIPFCIFLLWKYRCHINIECIGSIKGIKYIYKYVYKGHNCTTMEFGKCQNEIKLYLDVHYVSQCEAFWWLMAYEMHAIDPNVVRLRVHLPGQQSVTWNKDGVNPLEEIVERAGTHNTMLTAYFKANAQYEDACDYYYQDFPSAFVYNLKQGKWKQL